MVCNGPTHLVDGVQRTHAPDLFFGNAPKIASTELCSFQCHWAKTHQEQNGGDVQEGRYPNSSRKSLGIWSWLPPLWDDVGAPQVAPWKHAPVGSNPFASQICGSCGICFGNWFLRSSRCVQSLPGNSLSLLGSTGNNAMLVRRAMLTLDNPGKIIHRDTTPKKRNTRCQPCR